MQCINLGNLLMRLFTIQFIFLGISLFVYDSFLFKLFILIIFILVNMFVACWKNFFLKSENKKLFYY